MKYNIRNYLDNLNQDDKIQTLNCIQFIYEEFYD